MGGDPPAMSAIQSICPVNGMERGKHGMVSPKSTTLPAEDLPPPAGSHWERCDSRHSRLVRFTYERRETIRQLTALRSLEVGVSAWEFVTDTPHLSWVGRWQSRREAMRRLEVAVDGRIRPPSRSMTERTTARSACLMASMARHTTSPCTTRQPLPWSYPK